MSAASGSDFAMFSRDHLKQRCTVEANRQPVATKACSRLSNSFFRGLTGLN